MKYAICGRDGSGKSRLLYELGKLGLRTLKSYTTRPPRNAKEDSYHFIKKEELGDYPDRCLEMEYNGETYFADKKDVENADAMVLDPNGVMELIAMFPNDSVHIVWVSPDDEEACKARAMGRAGKAYDTEAELKAMEERAKDDRFDLFEAVLKLPNAIAINATCVHFVGNDFNKNSMRDMARALYMQHVLFDNIKHIIRELKKNGCIDQVEGQVACEKSENEIKSVADEIAVDVILGNQTEMNKLVTTWLMNTKLD